MLKLRLFAALALALCCVIAMTGEAARTCTSIAVPVCQQRANRDILFLLDASQSLDPARFLGEMLDFTQSVFCGFNTQDTTRAGVIVYSSTVREMIVLKQYTRATWFEAVESLRATPNTCCSCCTSTGNAFQLARTVFNRVPADDSQRLVITMTSSLPMANKNGQYAFPGTTAAQYAYSAVPTEANALKNLASPVRLMVIGVPTKNMAAAQRDYFAGIPNPGQRPSGKAANYQCITRESRRSCAFMNTPPFPIVSLPINSNLFSTNAWNVQSLMNIVLGSVCQLTPTQSPTKGPPTTRSPTSKSPTKAPTVAPTRSPITPELRGLDLFILMDRSRSMRWVPNLCRKAPGGDMTADDVMACWKLFITFVGSIVQKSATIPFRNTQSLGWQDDFTDKTRGIRVSMYAFACKNKQSVPVTVVLAEKVTNATAFQAALQQASMLVPDGGTCPGAAIERAAAQAQGVDGLVGDQLDDRIMKAALLLTDGVFYDAPRSAQAAKGLFHFNVMTYAMAIAVPYNGVDHGLTNNEIRKQKEQLKTFVQNDETRLINLGVEGVQALDNVADSFAKRLPLEVIKNIDKIIEQPWWCGWTSPERCTSTAPGDIPTGKYCKWNNGLGVCLNKIYCNHRTKDACTKDPYCNYTMRKCVTRKRYLPGGVDAIV